MGDDVSGSAHEFAKAMATLAKLSKGSNYRVIQEDIMHKLLRCFARMPPPQALVLLSDSISALVGICQPDADRLPAGGGSAHEGASGTGASPSDAACEGAANTMAVHLLLDILPALCTALPADARRDAAVRQRTARLFAACLAPARMRMAAKVAAGFGLDPPALQAAGVLQDLPRQGSGASRALGLLRQPPSADDSGATFSFGPRVCLGSRPTCAWRFPERCAAASVAAVRPSYLACRAYAPIPAEDQHCFELAAAAARKRKRCRLHKPILHNAYFCAYACFCAYSRTKTGALRGAWLAAPCACHQQAVQPWTLMSSREAGFHNR